MATRVDAGNRKIRLEIEVGRGAYVTVDLGFQRWTLSYTADDDSYIDVQMTPEQAAILVNRLSMFGAIKVEPNQAGTGYTFKAVETDDSKPRRNMIREDAPTKKGAKK